MRGIFLRAQATLFFLLMSLAPIGSSHLFAAQNKVCVREQCFTVELAQTPQELARGLQFYPSLDSDSGMFFIFPQNGTPTFWMKNTLVALDIIWINEAKQIVHVTPGALPCREDPCPVFRPSREARYVLEINAGLAQKQNINIGDEVRFEFP